MEKKEIQRTVEENMRISAIMTGAAIKTIQKMFPVEFEENKKLIAVEYDRVMKQSGVKIE